ncbi:zinc finger MYM-type protein 1-like protein [Tanacetum coccineum]
MVGWGSGGGDGASCDEMLVGMMMVRRRMAASGVVDRIDRVMIYNFIIFGVAAGDDDGGRKVGRRWWRSPEMAPKIMERREVKVMSICLLVEKCYPADFTEQERVRLKYELELLNISMKENLHLSHISTLAGLCISFVKTEKRKSYCMIDRLIRLVLTLPVSTATTERAFSTMKICKNRLRNKMADDFLADNLVVYIEKEIAESFSSEYVVDVFKNLKGRKADL